MLALIAPAAASTDTSARSLGLRNLRQLNYRVYGSPVLPLTNAIKLVLLICLLISLANWCLIQSPSYNKGAKFTSLIHYFIYIKRTRSFKHNEVIQYPYTASPQLWWQMFEQVQQLHQPCDPRVTNARHGGVHCLSAPPANAWQWQRCAHTAGRQCGDLWLWLLS